MIFHTKKYECIAMPMSDKEEFCYVTFIRLKNIPNICWTIILDKRKFIY